MKISLKTKIWSTILVTVLMFSFFTMFYFPKAEARLLLNNYNNEVQNLANTVSLGVKIAMTEQNFEGVHTAMAFVKEDTRLKFVSMLQTDTIWNSHLTSYEIKEEVFKTVYAGDSIPLIRETNDSVIVKRSSFITPSMTGAILIGFSTNAINARRREIIHTSLLVSGLVSVLGILMGLWLAKKISGPVLRLRNAAFQVGNGDFSQRVTPSSGDEIADLGLAFNKMVEELARSTKRLNESNQSLAKANETLNTTLEELKSAQNQLIQAEKMASLGELTAGIAHEIQNPLNFVNNFSEISIELAEEMEQEVSNGMMEEAIALSADIRQNLQKIAHHGKRADGIVKSMLQHSRQSTGQMGLTDINALVDEYLRLSYHGMRARDKSFNVTLDTRLSEQAGKAMMDGQDIGRVLLNIFNNAFYSVSKKKQAAPDPGYDPMVMVRTERRNNQIIITIHDNGLGIPSSVMDKIYHPFFTTKPTGEGTGLGLSLSYDIITKAHKGKIEARTEEGQFAEFTITLPA